MRKSRRALVGILVLTCMTSVSGCTYPGSEECAENFAAGALSVDGVASAEFECGGSFGNPTQEGEILLDTRQQKEATSVIADIYRAYAGNESIAGGIHPVIDFLSASDPNIEFHDNDLNFNGSPAVIDMREKYCDDLDCESGVTK